MSAIVDGLLFSWKKNSDYAARLVSDLSDEQMMLQPAPEGKSPANHPAWIFSHLNIYLPVITSIIKGETFEDPKSNRFGMDSKPEADSAIYAGKDTLINEFVSEHEAIAKLLENAGPECLENEIVLERWKALFPTAAVALPYLMLLHENLHLGQLSAWRRIQGMPSV